ncbi:MULTISPECIES: D-alanyl-D-alanine carboxypeptidase family protein [Helcococcus]|uniref:D-alanyl-D-alanine carboxypeptidase family protein n=1 Tax=Helcococcus bovis TaxID=3153252 RepID=A0ABW9F7W1_9FIRM
MRLDDKLKKRQENRKNKKDRKRKQMRNLLIGTVLVVSVSLSIAYFSLSKNHNVNADTAKITSDVSKRLEDKFSDVVLSYKKVLNTSFMFSSTKDNPKNLLTLNEGEYVEFLGEENGWSKIKHKGQIGYVENSNLESTKENELKVIKGQLVVTKDYTIPNDFETTFDVETENAMLVMFEAMKREGLEIGVSRKYISSDAETPTVEEQKYVLPLIEQNELRTGKAIEVNIPNGATRVDFYETKEGKWLSENAYKFGFILRYPANKQDITGFISNQYIYRYVGSEVAKEMHDSDLTIEEYFK